MGDMLIDGEGFQLNDQNERALTDEGDEILISHDKENNILDEEGNPKMDEETGEPLKVEIFTPESPKEPNELDGLKTQVTTLTEQIEELNKANTGIKSDLETERGRRRDLETNTTPPAMTPEEQEEYLNEPMTRQEALNLQDTLRQDIKKSTRPLTESTSLASAKKNHEDFDEVSKLADEVLKNQPYLRAALNLSNDPSEMKYTFGKTHPKYIEGIRTKGKADTINTITNPKIKTSANVSGVSKTDLSGLDLAAAEKLQREDPEAFAKLPEATKQRLMGAI